VSFNENRRSEGDAVFMGVNQITCTRITCDIQVVKNAVVKRVRFGTDYTFCYFTITVNAV
jgi:hypothetical protein